MSETRTPPPDKELKVAPGALNHSELAWEPETERLAQEIEEALVAAYSDLTTDERLIAQVAGFPSPAGVRKLDSSRAAGADQILAHMPSLLTTRLKSRGINTEFLRKQADAPRGEKVAVAIRQDLRDDLASYKPDPNKSTWSYQAGILEYYARRVDLPFDDDLAETPSSMSHVISESSRSVTSRLTELRTRLGNLVSGRNGKS